MVGDDFDDSLSYVVHPYSATASFMWSRIDVVVLNWV